MDKEEKLPFSLYLAQGIREDPDLDGGRHTSFPFGEGYMTSRFILNKLDFNLASSSLLVFGLLVVVVVVACTVRSVVIVDKRVIAHWTG